MKTIHPKNRGAILSIAAWQVGVLKHSAGSNRVKYNTGYKTGDIMPFDFSRRKSKTKHVEIVEAVKGAALITVEGNTGTETTPTAGPSCAGRGSFPWSPARAGRDIICKKNHPRNAPRVTFCLHLKIKWEKPA